MSGRERAEIAVVMLSHGRGGLEQSFLDYVEALHGRGRSVRAIHHPAWPRVAELDALGVARTGIGSLGEWDPLAVLRLQRALAGAKAVITIGRRATRLVRRAIEGDRHRVQLGVTPNYSFKGLIGLPRVIATTRDIRAALIEAGQPEARIRVVPNLIRVPPLHAARPAPFPPIPTIGALGRFVAKKGFADLLDALARLGARPCKLILAGDGPETPALRERIAHLGLEGRVELPGWLDDPAQLFARIDLLVVPSHHEPFGIVVLEGMAHSLPVIVTDAEGPREIVRDGIDGLVVPRRDPPALANALTRLIDDPPLAARLAAAGRATVEARYDLPVVAAEIEAAVEDTLETAAPRSGAR
jgi:glycosyltransferase involved in cell wall biosynthesis